MFVRQETGMIWRENRPLCETRKTGAPSKLTEVAAKRAVRRSSAVRDGVAEIAAELSNKEKRW